MCGVCVCGGGGGGGGGRAAVTAASRPRWAAWTKARSGGVAGTGCVGFRGRVQGSRSPGVAQVQGVLARRPHGVHAGCARDPFVALASQASPACAAPRLPVSPCAQRRCPGGCPATLPPLRPAPQLSTARSRDVVRWLGERLRSAAMVVYEQASGSRREGVVGGGRGGKPRKRFVRLHRPTSSPSLPLT